MDFFNTSFGNVILHAVTSIMPKNQGAGMFKNVLYKQAWSTKLSRGEGEQNPY